MRILLIVALSLLGTASLTAQARETRVFVSRNNVRSASSDYLFLDGAGGVTLDRGQDVSSFSTGVAVPGGVVAIGTPHIEHLLVVGRDPLGGKVEHWSRSSTGAWILTSARAFPTCDFTGVDMAAGSIYLLDSISGCVLRGPWDVSIGLDALDLAVWITPTSAPPLADAGILSIAYLDHSKVRSLPASGLFLWRYFDPSTVRAGWLLTDALGVSQCTPAFWDRVPGLQGPLVDEQSAPAGSTSVRVLVSGAQDVEVIDDAGTVMGAVSSISGQSSVFVSLSAPLMAGRTYGVRAVGATFSRDFVCFERFGFPEPFSGGTRLDRTPLDPVTYRVGNAGFRAECPISRVGSSSAGENYIGILIVGCSVHQVVPFDNGQGTNALLASDYWLGATGGISADRWRGHVGMRLPIPNNVNLVGMTLRTQFAIHDGQWFRLSEVVGGVLTAP
jgi:hypothetical protein